MNTDKQYKYINFRLYKEFFRQLSILSLIFYGILMLFTVLIPVNILIDMSPLGNASKTVVPVTTVFLHFIIIFTVYVPVLVLYAFNFLTKRNASDYYHSFPHTRPCLYLTLTASILTWILIVLSGNVFVSILIYTVFSKYLVLNIGKLLLFSLSIFICSLLVTASITLACSVTGTTFTNVAVSGLIIFLPRILITFFCEVITSSHAVLISSKLFPLFYMDKNIVFNTVCAAFDMSTELSFYKATPLIYTFLLAMVYFAAACFLFTKRKSETAGTPASGKKTQIIIRISIALPVTLVAIVIIFNWIITGSINSSDIFNIFLSYVIAIIIMFIYEFISTKKIRNVVNAIPSAGILILTNIVIIAGMYVIDTSQLNYTPSGKEIEYFTILRSDYEFYNDTYLDLVLENQKITEPSLVNFVSDKLAENVKQCKNDDAFNRYYYTEDYNTITVGIKSGPFVKYRKLFMSYEDYEKFFTDLYSIDEIKQKFVNLPEYNRYSSLIDIPMDEKTSEELYNTLRDELKSVDPAEWAALVSQRYCPFSLTYMQVIDDNDTTTYTRMPLCALTPKTLLAYINTVNSLLLTDNAGKNAAQMIEKADENPDDMDYSIELSMYSDDYTYEEIYCYFNAENDSETREPLVIHGVDSESKMYGENIEMEEDVLATVYDVTEIKDFVKNSFNNAAPIDSLDKEGYSLVSIHLRLYNYSPITYDVISDSYHREYDGEIDETVYIWIETDKINQFITEHAAK